MSRNVLGCYVSNGPDWLRFTSCASSFVTDKLTIEQNWGYQEAAYDLNVNQGCLLYRLFLRTLPNHFKPNSIYAHYPMTVPEGRLLSAVCDDTDLTNV